MDTTFFAQSYSQAVGALSRPGFRDLRSASKAERQMQLPSGLSVAVDNKNEVVHITYKNGTEVASCQTDRGKTVVVRTADGQFALRQNEGLWFFID